MASPPKGTVVIKVGTSSLLRSDGRALALSCMASLVETVVKLREAGHPVVVISSGAVGVGCQRLGLAKPPAELAKRQALAAVGQIHLMNMYDQFFTTLDLSCAQVLLSYDNLGVKAQYHNARGTFRELIDMGVVPIVNENDTVAVEELRFGDNDRLGALVAGLVDAKWLFLLTDVDGLYSSNPRTDPSARRIPVVVDVNAMRSRMTTAAAGESGSGWGTGGMFTKVIAAGLASAAGVRTVVMHAKDIARVPGVVRGTDADQGTHFMPLARASSRTRKRWINGLNIQGKLMLDAGATKAIIARKSLFAAGIRAVEGSFSSEAVVAFVGHDGDECGRGLVNYDSDELAKLCGIQSDRYERVLGYNGSQYVAHRSNIVVSSDRLRDDSADDDDDRADELKVDDDAGAWGGAGGEGELAKPVATVAPAADADAGTGRGGV